MIDRRRRTLRWIVLLALAVSAPTSLGVGARQVAAAPEAAPGQSLTMLPDGRLLYIGGDRTPSAVLVFDPVSGTSKSLTTLGAARAWHTATVLPDGTVLIAGGSDRQGRLVEGGERLDPTTGALTAMADGAPAARARHTATLLTDGRVLLSGGTHGGNARAEVWDPATGTSAVVPGPPSYERQHG